MVVIFAQPKVTQRSKSSNVVSPIMNIMNILMVILYWVIINTNQVSILNQVGDDCQKREVLTAARYPISWNIHYNEFDF